MAALGRLRSCSRLLQTQLAPQAAQAAAAGAARPAQQQLQHLRGFASGHGHGVTYEGLTLHPPARWHVMWGTGMCALMWFWVMYRAYYDGDAFLHGHAVHFEHDDHHDDKEGHH